ncbi:hypothetical protein GCM10008955_35130 [Deinococcus malanensis]|uniref:Uncharacterized protein n=1 Tax=Deinococcus malanensis TaxID=1706855 RepID=A0ABQ2F3V9_9DEIO|nr:hypothetical protein GCM10008955_35130 [Deinococcus malanensis]
MIELAATEKTPVMEERLSCDQIQPLANISEVHAPSGVVQTHAPARYRVGDLDAWAISLARASTLRFLRARVR